MKKMIALLLTLALCASFAFSAAADALFTEACRATILARNALMDKYGLTQSLCAYFEESVAAADDGYTVTFYAANEDLDYVLGRYTVSVTGDTALASWSWDGKENPYADFGLASSAWGKDQLTEIWLINKQTSDMQHYAMIAVNLAKAAGFGDGYIAEIPEIWDTEDPIPYDPTLATLSNDECRAIALRGLQEAYGLSDKRLAQLRVDDEGSWYDVNKAGEPVQSFTCILWDEARDWQDGDGLYLVTVNQSTGLIEAVSYTDGIIGNG